MSIFTSQGLFQSGNIIDVNKNNVGEYGTLGELTGLYLRSGETPIKDFLYRSLASIQPSSQGYLAQKYNYFYQIFLPGLTEVITDANEKSASKKLDIYDCDFQETRFRAYAWPAKKGNWTFVIDQTGEVLCVHNVYYGLENMPKYNSAISSKTKDSSQFEGLLQDGEVAIDGNVWTTWEK